MFFFFQAEDGIRDHCVTGVQTCALPISLIVGFCMIGFTCYKTDHIVCLFIKNAEFSRYLENCSSLQSIAQT